MARATTTELVNKIYAFCEAYSGVKFFPYQEQFAKRIIRSVLENDGEELTGLFSRQSGKSEVVSTISGGLAIILPILANMPMFAGDPRLETFKDGVLIGIFAPSLHQAQITFNRIKQRMYSRSSQAILDELGIEFEVNNGQNVALTCGSIITCMSASEGSNIEGKSYMIIIVDEGQDVSNFKYSKSISPMGAFYNATKIIIGTPTITKNFFYYSIERNKREQMGSSGRRNHFQYDWKVVVKYNPKYAKYIEGEKKRLGEESDEFQMSYCLKWILERGMFITPELFNKLTNSTFGLILTDKRAKHVVGIDCGKQSDSTVVTILEVDYENPVIVEESKELNIPDYITYHKTLKNWLEIQGDDWESQYYEIMDFLSNYSIVRIVVDATGVGSPIADRIQANVDCEVIPYVMNKPSKSALYKHFSTEIRASRLTIPYNEDTEQSIECRKFEEQMVNLQKSYSGQDLVVSHPDERGAHDDYPDSCALACWGARGDGVDKPVMEKSPFRESKRLMSAYYNARNSRTAKRR